MKMEKMDMPENKAVSELNRLMRKHQVEPLMLANCTGVTPARIYEMLNGRRLVTASSDLYLTAFFNLQPGYFLKLQIDYELEAARMKNEEKLNKIKTIDEIVKR